MENYRIVEVYGRFNNLRWELQKKIQYYKDSKKVDSWKLCFTSRNKSDCEKALKRRLENPQKNYSIPFEDALLLFN